MRGKSSWTTLAVLVAIGMLAVAASAGATITADHRRDRCGRARWHAAGVSIGSGLVRGAAIPADGDPGGRRRRRLRALPQRTARLTRCSRPGDATQADQPDRRRALRDPDDGDETRRPDRGDSALDTTVLAIPIVVPRRRSTACRSTSASCPRSTRTSSAATYNDAFIAELRLPRRGRPLGVDGSTGLDERLRARSRRAPGDDQLDRAIAMSAADAAGTPYGGATAPLRAKTRGHARLAHPLPVDLRSERSATYDSVVFVDALRVGNESAATCVRGSQAIGPALAITGPGPGFTVAHADSRR